MIKLEKVRVEYDGHVIFSFVIGIKWLIKKEKKKEKKKDHDSVFTCSLWGAVSRCTAKRWALGLARQIWALGRIRH